MEHTSSGYVMSTLRSLRLMEFDWDGADGLPLRGDVADTVHEIYEALDCAAHLPVPVVALNSDGTIGIDYEDADTGRELLLTFRCSGVVTYIKAFEDEQTTVEGTIRFSMLDLDSDGDFPELTDLFDWFAGD